MHAHTEVDKGSRYACYLTHALCFCVGNIQNLLYWLLYIKWSVVMNCIMLSIRLLLSSMLYLLTICFQPSLVDPQLWKPLFFFYFSEKKQLFSFHYTWEHAVFVFYIWHISLKLMNYTSMYVGCKWLHFLNLYGRIVFPCVYITNCLIRLLMDTFYFIYWLLNNPKLLKYYENKI